MTARVHVARQLRPDGYRTKVNQSPVSPTLVPISDVVRLVLPLIVLLAPSSRCALQFA